MYTRPRKERIAIIGGVSAVGGFEALDREVGEYFWGTELVIFALVGFNCGLCPGREGVKNRRHRQIRNKISQQ